MDLNTLNKPTYDRDLTERVCNLTCDRSDVVRNQTSIKYDTQHPLRKYYSFKTIKGALDKFLGGEWDGVMLSHWACIYLWILLGGCAYRKTTENLNSFERYCRDSITWAVDGLSFFDQEYSDGAKEDICNMATVFEAYDHVWQTRSKWRVYYSAPNKRQKENGEQTVLLTNRTDKEFMIIFSDHIENGFEDKYFEFLSGKEFVNRVERCKKEGYKLLLFDEEYYCDEIEDMT